MNEMIYCFIYLVCMFCLGYLILHWLFHLVQALLLNQQLQHLVHMLEVVLEWSLLSSCNGLGMSENFPSASVHLSSVYITLSFPGNNSQGHALDCI